MSGGAAVRLPSGILIELVPRDDPGEELTPFDFDRAALAQVLVVRREQIERYGHTPEMDADVPLWRIPQIVAEQAAKARSFAYSNHRKAARKALARVAALCLAAMARLDIDN